MKKDISPTLPSNPPENPMFSGFQDFQSPSSSTNVKIEDCSSDEEIIEENSRALPTRTEPDNLYPALDQIDYSLQSQPLTPYDPLHAQQQLSKGALLNKLIKGTPRSITEDHSSIAFGDQCTERFGSCKMMPRPSAPPLTEEDQAEIEAWARATAIERKHPQFAKNNERFHAFFENSGQDTRSYQPNVTIHDLPEDFESQKFKNAVMEAYENYKKNGMTSTFDTPALASFLGIELGIKNYAAAGKYYIPDFSEILDSTPYKDKINELANDPQRDEVQKKVSESHKNYVQNWVTGKLIESGTLEIRMNVKGAIVILGEGYKTLNFPSAEGWEIISSKVPKDTEYYHVPGKFTIIRIKPGFIGLCQKATADRSILRLLPGRYVLNEREIRYIGLAKIIPNQHQTFTVHPQCNDLDIKHLADRHSIYYLQKGSRLFVKDRKGTHFLDPDDLLDRPFLFDNAAGEQPLNCVNARDFLQAAKDDSFFIVRLKKGERVFFRNSEGTDIVWEYQSDVPESIYLSALYFDFYKKVYGPNDGLASAESMVSVRLSFNETLVLRDPNLKIRFLNNHESNQAITIRTPWQVLEIIPSIKNEYIFPVIADTRNRFEIARVNPGTTQWPVVYSQRSGEIQLYPPSIPYVFSSMEGHIYLGMADQAKNGLQRFIVPEVSTTLSIFTVASGQCGTCRINNVAFFLNPFTEAYILKSPNTFLGLIDSKQFHINIENSDLHRVYIPAGMWAVAMINGQQHILDPAYTENVSGSYGNGIWIFRAQQFILEGPASIAEKTTTFFNVTRIQVPMNEIAFGVNSRTGEKIIWGPGNHTINKNDGTMFQGFFQTQLDDVKISDFDVVWKGGVSGKIDVSVGFHIDGIDDITGTQRDLDKIKLTLGRCQDHEELRNKVIENTKHHLLDVIARIEPLGYGSTMSETGYVGRQASSHKDNQKSGLQDLEQLFSHDVQEIFSKYGIVVDNVTITRNVIDPHFVKISEQAQKERMEARKEVLIAEQKKEKEQIEQQRELQSQRALVLQTEEKSKQRNIERERENQDIILRAEAEKKAELGQKELEIKSQIEQKKLLIEEKKYQKEVTLIEAETKAIQETAHELATAKAALAITDIRLDLAEKEAKIKNLQTEVYEKEGLAKAKVKQAEEYPGLSPDQVHSLKITAYKTNQFTSCLEKSIGSGMPAGGLTQMTLSPEILTQLGAIGTLERLFPNPYLNSSASSVFNTNNPKISSTLFPPPPQPGR